MKNWMACGLLLLGCISTVVSYAAPKDKSLDAWKRVQDEANAKVETDLKKQFASELQRIEDLKTKIYKINREVSVFIVKGRTRKITGVFKGITEKGKVRYVDIGDHQYLLSDIDGRNRYLLLFGAKPELRPSYLDQETRRLEKEMARVRDQKRLREYARRGYDESFMNAALKIGDRFYDGDDLGLAKMRVRIDINKDSQYAEIRIANRINSDAATRLPTVATFVLGDKPVACTTTDVDNPKDSAWVNFAFFVDRKDLGSDPMAKISNGMVIHFAGLDKLKTSWTARLKTSKRLRKRADKSYRGELRAQLLPKTQRKVDKIAMLTMVRRILRARVYQGEAADKMKKKGVLLPATTIGSEKQPAPKKDDKTPIIKKN